MREFNPFSWSANDNNRIVYRRINPTFPGINLFLTLIHLFVSRFVDTRDQFSMQRDGVSLSRAEHFQLSLKSVAGARVPRKRQ